MCSCTKDVWRNRSGRERDISGEHRESLTAPLHTHVMFLCFLLVGVAMAGAAVTAFACPAVTFVAEELWRRGDENDTLIFGLISDVSPSIDGRRLYVLDQQLCEITVFDREGQVIQSRNVCGGGPGEVTRPNSIFGRPGGGFGIVQRFPPRIVLLDSLMVPIASPELDVPMPAGATSYFFSGATATRQGVVVGATLLGRAPGVAGQTRTPAFVSFDSAIDHPKVATCKSYNIDFSASVFTEEMLDIPLLRWTVGGSGRIFTAPEVAEFRVDVYDCGGDVLKTIREPVSHRERTADRLVALEGMLRASFGNVPKRVEFKLDRTEPPIEEFLNGLTRRGDEEVWVRFGAGYSSNGGQPCYCVYDNDGNCKYKVAIDGVGPCTNDLLYFWGLDRIVRIVNVIGAYDNMTGSDISVRSQDDPAMQVVVYQLKGQGQ